MTLVSNTNAQEAGKRKPMTIAAASMIWMLPALISDATGTVNRTKIVNGPAIQTNSARRIARQIATKASNGIQRHQPTRNSKAGE